MSGSRNAWGRAAAGYGDRVSGSDSGVAHRHGRHAHRHPHSGAHRHFALPRLSETVADAPRANEDQAPGHHNGGRHGHHSHGLVDPSIVRSHEGIKAVSLSLAVLGLAAGFQVAIFVFSGSVALLADVIHNVGDALTALPLGIAFFLRSARAERLAGLAVVLAIFISACVALYESIERLIHPQQLSNLWVLALAGIIGFAGNELAARIRLRAGNRLDSTALMADGNHARADGFVSLGVVASAAFVAIGVDIADPLVGLFITLVILKITWVSWGTVRQRSAYT
jgi:Co/Zn/Cd efflux system component